MATRAYLAGPRSLRAESERRMLVLCLLATPVSLYVTFRLTGVGPSQLAILVIGALVFVSFARGRLLGGSVRLGEGQLPEIHAVTAELAARLGIEPPHVFVRDDTFTALGAVGTSAPYSLILSSQYLEHLSAGELRFLIARELAHMAAGHTRVTSLLSASGRENPLVALVFGAWLRRTELTADRVALALAPGIDDALRAIAIANFHAIGRRVDLRRLLDQQRDLDAEPALRLGEWSSSMPYATSRFHALGAFSQTAVYAEWNERFARDDAPPTAEPAANAAPPEGAPITRAGCAPIGARLSSVAIDAIAVAAIASAAGLWHPVVIDVAGKPERGDPAFVPLLLRHLDVFERIANAGFFFTFFFVYCAVLVVVLGQTLGMIVMDLRVVTTTNGRPGRLQIAARYAIGLATVTFGWAAVGFFRRVHPHDWLSRTRVVRTRAAPARDAAHTRARAQGAFS